MLSSDLIRWGALAAALGGALSILFVFVGENSGLHVPLDTARHALLVGGIAAIYLYVRQSSGRFGAMGTVGFYLCSVVFAAVTILDIGILVSGAVEQWYILIGPGRALFLIVGLVLFGAAILRARVLPSGGAWLLIAAALANVVGILIIIVSGGRVGAWIFIVPTILFGLGWVWLGYGLWSERDASTDQSPRVR